MRKIKYSTTPYKKYTQCIGVCLLVTVLSGCSKPPDIQEHSAEIPFSITWQPELPRAEQAIVFSLILPSEVKPELSEVRGVSMYMGRIPLPWRQIQPGQWQAELVVGACTEPTMQWQLTVPLQSQATASTKTERLEPLRVTFFTVTN
jgi:hypothetical protein